LQKKNGILPYYLVVFAGCGLLYTFTCAPGVLWQDSGLFQYRIWHNDIEGNLGLALSHPLYILIGIAAKNIVWGELAYRINLISVVFGALTIANVFGLLRLWLGKNLPAIIAAITLALSWTTWQHAVIAEVYTLYLAQFTAELIILFQFVRTRRTGYLYLLAFLNGLALANHLWAVIPLLCYIVFLVILVIRKHLKGKHIAIAAVLWMLGALPYEYLIIKNIIQTGDIAATMVSAIYGNSWQERVLNASVTLKMAAENFVFIILNFPTPNILLFFVGIYSLYKISPSRGFANMLLGLVLLFFLFAFRYVVPDRHAFFLPFYVLTAIAIGLGADVFLSPTRPRWFTAVVLLCTLLPIPTYMIAPAVARKMYKSLGQRRQVPFRDDYTYFLQPWQRGYDGARLFAESVFDTVKTDAVIWADSTTVHSLLYAQEVKGKRRDIKIVSEYDSSKNAPVFNEQTIDKLLTNHSIYVISPIKSYCPGFLWENHDFEPAGCIWQVLKRKETTQ